MFVAQSIRLAGDTDFAGFRARARELLRRGVAPEDVTWSTNRDASLFDDLNAADPSDAVPSTDPESAGGDGPAASGNPSHADASTIRLPRELIALFGQAALHEDPQRFALLYRLLWRLQHEPGLRHDPLDADTMRVQRMAQAVRRDMHKMKAFVRFRPIDDGGAEPLHVAWFEPSHHIVQATAPFFTRRFTAMRWAILTPRGSAHWQPGDELLFGPPARREDAPPADAGEALWLTYYRHIFNPARLKLKMMQKEMPRKYWHNLPEAVLIAPLAAGAHERSANMVDEVAAGPKRRLPTIKVLPVTMAADEDAPVRSLATLRDLTNHCRECPIGACATQSVCGEGPLQAKFMFVGEQPGDQEDLQGRPFVGPAGQLLDRAFDDLGIQRGEVFVSNAVKHFKYELRGKRRIHKTPSQREAAACQHWLDDEIAMVQPRLLVALGATAARSLLGRAVPVMANRGQVFERDDGRKVLVTLHPSALLRLPAEEREAAYAAWLADLDIE